MTMTCPKCKYEWSPTSNPQDIHWCPLCRTNLRSVKGEQTTPTQPINVRLSGFPFVTKLSVKTKTLA